MAELHPFESFEPVKQHPLSPLIGINELRRHLIVMRVAAGKTQLQVAEEAEWSPRKVIRLEHGPSGIALADARTLLLLYGVQGEARELFETRVRTDGKIRRNNPLVHMHKALAVMSPLEYWEAEADARSIRMFSPSFLPDIMQPVDYANAVERMSVYALSPEQKQAAADLRQQRAAYLLGKYGPVLRMVIDEAVLTRRIGDNGYDTVNTAIDGLKYLNTAGQSRADSIVPDHLNPNISVQIAPFGRANYIPLLSDYSIFGIPQPKGTTVYTGGPFDKKVELPNPVNCWRNFEAMAAAMPGPEETNVILEDIQAANAQRRQ